VKKILLVVLVIFVFNNALKAQEELTKARFDKHYFKSYLLDIKDVAISPIKWNAKQWISAGMVIGTAALLVNTADLKLQQYSQTLITQNGDNFSANFLEPWGSGVYSMATMAVFYTQGLIAGNQRSKKVAMLGVKAYIVSGLYVQIPKYAINRKRPYHGEYPDPYGFEGVCGDAWFKGMPSGHTTSIFAVATIVASEYSETIWVPIVAYTVATLASLSRIYDNKHWGSDVLVGAAFGFAIGKLIHRKNNWGLTFR